MELPEPVNEDGSNAAEEPDLAAIPEIDDFEVGIIILDLPPQYFT